MNIKTQSTKKSSLPPFTFLLLLSFIISLSCRTGWADTIYPEKEWATASPHDVGMNEEKLSQARDYALTGNGSGYITRYGKLVMTWGDLDRRYDLKSTTKSFGSAALGLALKDALVKLNDRAIEYHPALGESPESNIKTGWLKEITLLHLATQTAGFEKPGGYKKLLFKPGTKWHYSDGGPNWLAECLTLLYKKDLRELMFERVFTPLGIEKDDLTWRENAYRPHSLNGIKRREFGSGISANVDAMARFGYLFLCEGVWKGKRILSIDYIKMSGTSLPWMIGLPEYDSSITGNCSTHYSLLWWNNADGTLSGAPRDTYWSWGLYDSLIVVIPSMDIVVSRTGKSWKRTTDEHYDPLKPFIETIVASVKP